MMWWLQMMLVYLAVGCLAEIGLDKYATTYGKPFPRDARLLVIFLLPLVILVAIIFGGEKKDG